jgi:hypothetical protein
MKGKSAHSRTMDDISMKNRTVSLRLNLEADAIHTFFPLLQQGFMVKVRVGCSIKTMLCEQFGLSPQYVETRIKTIFLDGKPVDDIDSAIVKEGSTLALSAAMPGLAGAILRSGGQLAPLRGEIAHREGNQALTRREGMVILKLFNLIMDELGSIFLKRGILLRREHLKSFLIGLGDDFWAECKGGQVDGQEVGLDNLLRYLDKYNRVMLRVHRNV